ncbi:MAG: glutamyl aminopeptidase [Alkalibacterium gilvum]|uniref:Glutamyl aminopeptidase n=1 Tax=Alkalibacterium gilvum TaxID=1130080 RepID=A0A1H6TPL9_9LACT|nr:MULTISPECIES: glutamyl aminopeptidase [Alkalibacterium]MDN6293631.1 glutamyl aminopeptidase [Alkalibacterium sp.]MDN6294921.1 glutamyl aminopeptidase [Alkalibacterium sp.]MDN6397495.1 glutamyl aminopeptidase [Alkalibacterium sp.]MDN6728690.1 glutamyl aminopeptidase [Alkalibacterium sp.]SEI78155.1 glutamyl aminopeptidase [Alkalibacterium gilvum]
MTESKINLNTKELIKKTTQLQGTSGFEHNIRTFMREEMSPFVDELDYDGLGGVFGVKHSENKEAPKLMVAAHMDEVGFMVSSITKNGLMKVLPLGGWNPYVVSSQRFTLQTKMGNYPVVSSSVPPHLLKNKESKKLSIEDILFDGGFESKDEAEAFGVRPGDPLVPDVETIETANGKSFIGKAWDNRFGVTLVLELLKMLEKEALPNTLIAGANVQEEVGLRGTKGAVRKFDPDAFLAVDCSPANDLNGNKESFGRLGEGFLLRIQDPGMILSKEMKEFLLDTAETNNIPYQYFFSKGGTDAVAAHQLNKGIPSAVIGVPARYIHTHQSLFRIDDYEAAREMVYQTVKAFDRSTLETLKIK